MDDMKTEKWTLEDGRRAERRVTEQNTEDGQVERVVELHVEAERPMMLQKRVIEKSKPIVYERMVETVDPKTGLVVDQKVESIEPQIKMQLVEHIAVADNAEVQSMSSDCHVTKEEMIETIIAAIKANRDLANRDLVTTVDAQSVPSTDLSNRLKSLGLADEIATRVESFSTREKIIYGVIAFQFAYIAYSIFF